MKIAAFVIALGGAVLPLVAQETVKVHLVEVPVTVLDRDFNPIRGLKAENFELFDDGKRQKITAFDAIDFASKESLSAISPQNPNARRSFILVFDLENSQHKSIPRARTAARKFIAANVLPHDLVAVAFIGPPKGLKLLTAISMGSASMTELPPRSQPRSTTMHCISSPIRPAVRCSRIRTTFTATSSGCCTSRKWCTSCHSRQSRANPASSTSSA